MLIESWWENTDGYNMIIKRWLANNPDFIEQYVNAYYNDGNMWKRRASIICQLNLNDQTNFPLLKKSN